MAGRAGLYPELLDRHVKQPAAVLRCRLPASALQAELGSRPANWTLEDSIDAAALKLAVASCGVAIILIALTIIFFRLEVSFRSLRHLDRLKSP